MSDINIESIRTQLRDYVKTYKMPMRGKFALLFPLKSEILELHLKGAKSADISAILGTLGIVASKDTIARFIREETRKERNWKSKKTATTLHEDTTNIDGIINNNTQTRNEAVKPKIILPRI